MKYYIIENKNGKQEIQERKKGITLTRKKRLEEQGKKIVQIIEIEDKFLEMLKNNTWQTVSNVL